MTHPPILAWIPTDPHGTPTRVTRFGIPPHDSRRLSLYTSPEAVRAEHGEKVGVRQVRVEFLDVVLKGEK